MNTLHNSLDNFSQKDIKITNIVSKETEKSVLYVHEVGYLTSKSVSPTKRFQTDSFLFLYVVNGKGVVEYDGSVYKADSERCV